MLAALSQTFRNAMQRGLTASLGTIGATHVRFLFGLPFSLVFLALIMLATGASLPHFSAVFFGWVVVGAFAQIAATGLMLATMRSKSFVVTTAYTKTEPVQAALFGFVVLGDALSLVTTIAILIATAGVMLLSWPPRAAMPDAAAEPFDWLAVAQGIGAGGMFALSAIGFRAAIRTLEADNFVIAASATLVCGLILQARFHDPIHRHPHAFGAGGDPAQLATIDVCRLYRRIGVAALVPCFCHRDGCTRQNTRSGRDLLRTDDFGAVVRGEDEPARALSGWRWSRSAAC